MRMSRIVFHSMILRSLAISPFGDSFFTLYSSLDKRSSNFKNSCSCLFSLSNISCKVWAANVLSSFCFWALTSRFKRFCYHPLICSSHTNFFIYCSLTVLCVSILLVFNYCFSLIGCLGKLDFFYKVCLYFLNFFGCNIPSRVCQMIFTAICAFYFCVLRLTAILGEMFTCAFDALSFLSTVSLRVPICSAKLVLWANLDFCVGNISTLIPIIYLIAKILLTSSLCLNSSINIFIDTLIFRYYITSFS